MANTSLTEYNTQLDLRKDSTDLGLNCKNDHHKGVFILFGYIGRQFECVGVLILVVVCGFFAIGCGGDQPRDDQDSEYYTDRSSAVFAPEPESTPYDSQGTLYGEQSSEELDEALMSRKNIGGWTIVLANAGMSGMERAREMLRIIQEDAGLVDAYIDERPSGLVIAYGDYLDKSDPKAIKDLERIRKMDLMGVKLFESALITPPTSASLRGSNASFDLRTARERFGKKAVYTLQIGVYGRSDYQIPSAKDLADFRKAAEDAVRKLREQGDMAFYYHAPARSMVTVGVFGERDFISTTLPPTQSPALLAVRKKFPNNLLNGQGINETIRSESGVVTRMQSSQLVAIPEK